MEINNKESSLQGLCETVPFEETFFKRSGIINLEKQYKKTDQKQNQKAKIMAKNYIHQENLR